MITLSVMLCHLLLAFFFVGNSWASSSITISRDATCSKSLRNQQGPNGYPDGVCTPLNLEKDQGFQVVGLDSGCTVTIYGPNTDSGLPCSSETKIVAERAQCYNSTWVYYSIDGCNPPSNDTSIPTANLTTSTSPSSSPESESKTSAKVRTEIIAASVVGSLVLLSSALFSVFIVRRRRSRRNREQEMEEAPPPPAYEVSNDGLRTELNGGATVELANEDKCTNAELDTKSPASELSSGRNSGLPPVELPVKELVEMDGRTKATTLEKKAV